MEMFMGTFRIEERGRAFYRAAASWRRRGALARGSRPEDVRGRARPHPIKEKKARTTAKKGENITKKKAKK
jgi:hypothetical protein